MPFVLLQQPAKEFFPAPDSHFNGTAIVHDNIAAPALMVFLNVLKVDDMGIMNPAKNTFRKQVFIIFDIPGCRDLAAVIKKYNAIMAFRFEADDIPDRNKHQTVNGRYRQFLLCQIHRSHIVQQNFHFFHHPCFLRFFGYSIQRIAQVVDIYRLQQIIYGAVFKSPDGIIIESRHKDDLEGTWLQLIQQIERIALRQVRRWL